MRAYFIFLKIFVLSALLIVSNYNLALSNPVERARFGELYYTWLSDFFDKAAYITSFVVKSEWLPDSSILNESDNG
jgi:hypothetical protein